VEPEGQAATPFDLLVEDPDEGAVHLFWADRKRARLSIPKPRLLTPVPEQGDSTDEDAGSLLIEGENRQAMVSLLAQYREKVDVVLIDPPYNTGRRDLRYDDARFEDPDADVAKGDFVSAEDGGKHAKWLNQMAPTLRVIRDLMAPHGVILIHIDDRELPRLLLLMEEIFREPNRIGTIIWKNATENNPTQVAVEHEYIVVWAKNKPKVPRVWVGPAAETRDLMLARYAEMKADGLSDAGIEKAWKKFVARHKEEIGEFVHYNKVDEHGPYTGMRALHKPEKGGYFYDIEHPVTKKPVTIPMRGYRFPEPRLREMIDQGRIIFGSDETQLLQLKVRLEEADVALRSVIHLDGRAGSNDIERLFPESPDIFPNPKPVDLEEYVLSFVASKEALVLDCFAGSGTTGHAVMRLNKRDAGHRRFILIDEGTDDDPYVTTMTGERLRRARRVEALPGGFTFLRVDQRIDTDGLAKLQRRQLVDLIRQTDASGRGSRIQPVEGTYVIGTNARGEALCLHFDAAGRTAVTRDILRAMYLEAAELGLMQPLRVYATSSEVQTSDGFIFFKLPDEVASNLAMNIRAE